MWGYLGQYKLTHMSYLRYLFLQGLSGTVILDNELSNCLELIHPEHYSLA